MLESNSSEVLPPLRQGGCTFYDHPSYTDILMACLVAIVVFLKHEAASGCAVPSIPISNAYIALIYGGHDTDEINTRVATHFAYETVSA